MPTNRLPLPRTVPRNPATRVMPTCMRSHSEALSWLPAPSSRALMRISRLLFRWSRLAAADLAVASWSSWTGTREPPIARPVVYMLTVSSTVISRSRGTARVSTASRPSPIPPRPA